LLDSRVLDARKQELLRKAADLMGLDELALGLKVSRSMLDAWISGRLSMPTRKLVTLGDLLEEVSNPPKKK
jgi:hypothetical protein